MVGSEPVAAASTLGVVARFFWELIKVFLLALLIIVPIRYFVVQPFFVRGQSMEPTFQDGEYLVIDELSYYLREPRRGEVIVFRSPANNSQFFIKRIVGLPGETVAVDDGRVVITSDQYPQGVALDEVQYLTDQVRTGGQVKVEMGEGEFFVLGDNRPFSSDSRSWGPLAREAIVGRAWLRAFPIDRIGVIDMLRPGFLGT